MIRRLVLLGAIALPALAWAQTAPMKGGMGAMPMPKSGTESPSTTAYMQAMQTMDRGMAIPYTGDADRDFVAGMIPHHQGAVDMAKVELRYGHDPALHKLASDIIASQEKQIAFMRAWQASHP